MSRCQHAVIAANGDDLEDRLPWWVGVGGDWKVSRLRLSISVCYTLIVKAKVLTGYEQFETKFTLIMGGLSRVPAQIPQDHKIT